MKIKNIAILALCALLLTSCASTEGVRDVTENAAQSDASSVFALSMTDYSADGDGRVCVLEKKPERVAVLFSSYADIWTSAGGEIAVSVGESVSRGFVSDDVLLVDSSAGKTIDTELLLSYEPDFVICSSDLEAQSEVDTLLDSLGIPSLALHVETFDDYLAALELFTTITGDADAYQTYGLNVKAEIDALLAQNSNVSADKNILFVRAGSKASATKAKTASDNFVCAMLDELGVHNIADNAPVLLDGLSMEEIISCDPDFIFISTMGDETAARAYMDGVLASEGYSSLTAVKNGDYAYLPKDLFQFKPNARWAQAYEYLIGLLS